MCLFFDVRLLRHAKGPFASKIKILARKSRADSWPWPPSLVGPPIYQILRCMIEMLIHHSVSEFSVPTFGIYHAADIPLQPENRMQTRRSQPRALIFDRDVGSCLVLKKMMMALGFQCDVMHDLASCLQAIAPSIYNVVLAGCIHGDQACWEVSHAIRALPRGGERPAMIGIISFPDTEMQQRCTAMGMEGVLTKPVSKSELSDCIGHYKSQPHIASQRSFLNLGFTSDLSSSLSPSYVSEFQRKSEEKACYISDVPMVDFENMIEPLHLGELNRP